jgi:predicted ATPase
MIINICGANGQGKSQVLSHLKEEGYQVETLLSENISPQNTQEFCENQNQLFLYREKLIEDHQNSDVKVPLIIESSFIDMFVYSLFVVGINFDHKQWIDQYYKKCIDLQRNVNLAINLPLNSVEDTSLPYFTANSFNVLVKHYQQEVSHHCNIISIDVESMGICEEKYFQEICDKVVGVIQKNV